MARASIQDIAEIAGVSKMTVSRVLRGEGGSRHQEEILEAARRLDYIPVRTTVQNRRLKTGTIGILEDDEFLFQTEIGSQTFSGVAQATFANGYDLLMLHPQHQQPLAQRKIQFLDKRCEGFIFVVPHEQSEILELLVKNEIPAVTCYSTDVPEGVSWVIPDNEQAVREAIQLLVSQGHRHIGFWSAHQGHSDARQRTMAFTQSMQEAGLPLFQHNYLWETWEDRTTAEGALPKGKNIETSRELLTKHLTAVICHNDQRALHIWDQALEWGLKVPDDLSIVGIDDIPEAQQRGLTTFVNPFSEIGSTATKCLLSLLQGGSAEENCHKISMTLRERTSVAAPRTSPAQGL
ncbi:catabolite control protein A [Abditibacteriota bacterium]|nr:catabolite control protein A [Abditibacteriota bacterium]